MRCARRIVRRALPPEDGTLLSDLPPLLRRLYLARGVRTAQELDMSLDRLLPPQSLGQTAAAAKLLHEVLAAGGRILIAADFDADGATSCALAVSALRAMGAAQVGYLVPSRFAYGYGLSPRLVDTLADSPPDLLITVDNGISSVQGVSRARELGIRTLVTDHHLPGAALPEADVIVNPNFPGDPFPSKHLAGVGVIFYVILALRARLREAGWFAQRRLSEPNMADYLDLVALGTVADVVALDQNNRVLVEQGLRRIRAGKCRQGIAALLRVGGRNQSQTSASDLGFVVGPRLNAAGRLEDMGVGIECLLSEDPRRALQLAAILDELNRRRRDIESDMQTEALAQLDGLDGLIGERAAGPPAALCIYREHWHQGVVGILAARVRERYIDP